VLALVHLSLQAIAREHRAEDLRNRGSTTGLPAIGGPEIRQMGGLTNEPRRVNCPPSVPARNHVAAGTANTHTGVQRAFILLAPPDPDLLRTFIEDVAPDVRERVAAARAQAEPAAAAAAEVSQ
jgi:hypothetical protein